MNLAYDQIIDKFSRFIYPHPDYAKALKVITKSINNTVNSNQPMAAVLTGLTGTGKTTLIKHVIAQNYRKPQDIENTDSVVKIVPAYHCTVPADASIKALAIAMLKHLDGEDLSGNATILTKRLSTLIKTCQTQVIFLDEFQHLLSKKARNGGESVTDWVKTLMDETGVPVIIAGMPACEGIIDSHPQLSGRYPYRASLGLLPFDADNNIYMAKTIQSFINAIETHLNMHCVPKLYEEEYLASIYVATGGNMRSIRQLIIESLSNTIMAKRKEVLLEDIIDAVDVLTLNFRLTDDNPFLREHKENMQIIFKKK
jgi:predicted AAA+ superfamily ATPase